MNIFQKIKKLTIGVSAMGIMSLLAMSPAYAAHTPYSIGDVFAGVGGGHVYRYNQTGTQLDDLNTTSGSSEQTGMCFDSSNSLYATDWTAGNMAKFDGSGNLLTFPWGGPFSVHPESCVVDAAGNVYTGEVDGANDFQKFSPSGALLATYNPSTGPRGADWIDLAADQCTMYYTSEGSNVKRFNVCTNTQLSDFATGLAAPCFALRIRSNGEVMVTCTTQTYRLSSSGAPLQTYPIGGESLFAMNLDPDGTHFWTGGYTSRHVYKVDIATGAGTGAPAFTAASVGPTLAGLAIFGEPTVAKQDITLTPATATNPAGSNHTVTATVTSGSNPLPKVTVTFNVTSGPNTGATGTGVTDINGQATFTYTSNGTVGTDTIEACFTDTSGNQHCAKATKDWVSTKTTTTYTGSTTQDFNDPVTLSAKLVDSSNNPVSGAAIDFSLSSQTCSGTTDASGNASCAITPNEPAGTYTVTASYAGDVSHQPSSDSTNFIVTLEETTTSYTGSVNIAQGQPVSAVLKEDGLTAISGRILTLKLATGESCTGTTDGSGNVSCTLSGYPLGPNKITASFAGDTFYKPSSDSKAVLIFAKLSSGSFVLGDKTVSTASSSTDLTWWDAQWSKLNDLTGGSAPAAFKGFADTLSSSSLNCGGKWTTDPGNSSKPPVSIPSYMAVIVADSVSQSGSLISGDIPKVVIVKTDSGYADNPGHAGTGTVVATLCGK